jgi:hypothetical protein
MRTSFRIAIMVMCVAVATATPQNAQDAATTKTTIWGINSTSTKIMPNGNWIEVFEITVDPNANPPTAKARQIGQFQEDSKHSLGKGILVTGDSIGTIKIYWSFARFGVGTGDRVYVSDYGGTGSKLHFSNAGQFDNGFFSGIGDITGTPTDMWLNPFSVKSGRKNDVYEIVPNGRTWKIKKQLKLSRTGDQYDGLKLFDDDKKIIANREDANYPQCLDPETRRRASTYDVYSATDGKLMTPDFIKTDFRASGVAFDGAYFFVSEICNNKIAVYEKKGGAKPFAEADLPKPDAAPHCELENLPRCIEDLAVGKPLETDDQESGALSAKAPASPTQEAKTTLAVTGPKPNLMRAGEATSITASVQMDGLGVRAASVVFTRILGDVRFRSGKLALDGQQATLRTDESGRATLELIADKPGLSIIQAKVAGSTLNIYVNATSP